MDSSPAPKAKSAAKRRAPFSFSKATYRGLYYARAAAELPLIGAYLLGAFIFSNTIPHIVPFYKKIHHVFDQLDQYPRIKPFFDRYKKVESPFMAGALAIAPTVILGAVKLGVIAAEICGALPYPGLVLPSLLLLKPLGILPAKLWPMGRRVFRQNPGWRSIDNGGLATVRWVKRIPHNPIVVAARKQAAAAKMYFKKSAAAMRQRAWQVLFGTPAPPQPAAPASATLEGWPQGIPASMALPNVMRSTSTPSPLAQAEPPPANRLQDFLAAVREVAVPITRKHLAHRTAIMLQLKHARRRSLCTELAR